MCKLKHLVVAAAIVGLATQVQAGYFPGSTDFEDNPLTNAVIWSGIDNVAEAIVPDATVPSPRPATYTPSSFSATRANVLSVDNDVTSPIICNINGGAAMPAATIYADALVKGAPLANDASVPDLGPTDKLLVYTRVNAAGTDTNLCVLAKPDANSITNEYVLTSTHIGKDEWHRVIIEAVNDGTYKVYCDTFDQNAALGTYYPITAGSSMSSVAFAGTGSVDDLILSDLIPELPVTTLTWDTSFAGVSYVVGNQTNALNAADGSYEFQPAGPVTLIGNTGYRTITVSGSAGSTITLPAQAGIAKYFPVDNTPDGQQGTPANPYVIPDLAALEALQAAATETNCFGISFAQTANITLTNAWPGIGIQNGKDIVCYSTSGTGAISQQEADRRDAKWAAGAFKGSYDGGNFTISDFQMVGVAGNPDSTTEGLDYCGFFNSVDGATIKNLKIQYAGAKFAADTTASTKESGATFVGVAKNTTLVNLTSLQKDASTGVSCSKGFGGIVGYLFGTTVDSCTNNVNLTSLAANKCGGIAMICQQSGCSILNCQNNGTVTTGSSNGEFGGILGYTDTITISNCQNTAECKMFYHHGGTVTLRGTNKGNAIVQSYTGNATPGLNFATVDGNVATFIADSGAFALNGAYKVMASSATATFNFTEAGTITFDQSLYTPTYAITAAEGLDLTNDAGSPVITYTAMVASPSYNDPEGRLIEDYAVISWLSNNGFTQAQIDALGNNAAGTDRLYYCYLLNLNFTVQDASAALSFTEITVSNRVSMTVQLVRKAPLAGYINGALYIYGANDLAAGFGDSPIPDESVEYFTGDPSFNLVTGSNDTVTQTAVATMNTSVTAKFFKAVIKVPLVDNGDEPYWEPEPDPDPDPDPDPEE